MNVRADVDQVTVKMSSNGRILIPSSFRERLGWRQGEALRIIVESGEVRVESARAGLERARRLVQELWKGDGSPLDELVAERRAEAERE